jgi:SOS-response transcriptional repressor LexA
MTKRHRTLLEFIASEVQAKGCAPTRAEIAKKFDWWPNAVTDALKSLERSGAIKILPRKTRGIELTTT